MTKGINLWVGRLKALSLALLLVLSLACSLLISPLANASSPYDDPQYTPTLDWDFPGEGGGACDLTTSWFGLMDAQYSGDLTQYINDDYSWMVYRNVGIANGGGGNLYSNYYFYAVKKTEQTIGGGTFGYYGNNTAFKTYGVPVNVATIFNPGNYVAVDARINKNCEVTAANDFGSPFDDQFTGGGSTNSWAAITHDVFTPDNNEILFSNFDFIPPSGFDGIPPPDSVSIDESVYPEIEYTVENKKITLRYTGNIGGCSITWGYRGHDEGDPLITNSRPSGEPYVINADEYKKYSILVDLKYFGPPAICEPFPDDVNVSVLTFTLDVTGQDFSGNTGDMECSTEGDHTSCLVPSPFEDCSVYGVDIISGFGCVIRNFGVALSILLKTLFVPNPSAINAALDNLKQSFNSQMGFLLAPFTFLGSVIQQAIDTPVTGCSIHLGNFLGRDSTIDPCNLASRIPALFDFIRIVIQAGVLLLVMRGLMNKYHEVLKA